MPRAEWEDRVPQGALGGQAVVKGRISYNNIINVIMSFQVSICPNNDIITPFGQGIPNFQALSFAPSKHDYYPHFTDAREAASMNQWGKG